MYIMTGTSYSDSKRVESTAVLNTIYKEYYPGNLYVLIIANKATSGNFNFQVLYKNNTVAIK